MLTTIYRHSPPRRVLKVREFFSAVLTAVSLALACVPALGADPQSTSQGAADDPSKPASENKNQYSSRITPESRTAAQRELEEVVVTAQKREEQLKDVPVAVSVISPTQLLSSNQLRIQDYYTQVPGLAIAKNIESTQNIVLRGLSTGGKSNPTVGITLDDVPFGSSIGLSGGLVPDIDPNDLRQIEVLRGPQGALYGATSLGGLLKFTTVDPSTDSLTGRASAGTSSVKHGDEMGYELRGAVNVPLSDTFAVRASAFTRLDPGYLDNPLLDVDGINKATADGGRVAALWKLSDAWSLRLNALYQKFSGDGTDSQTGAGEFLQTTITFPLAELGTYEREFQAYSAIVKGKMGNVELTSLTGYSENFSKNSLDTTSVFGGLNDIFIPGAHDSAQFNENGTYKFSQEVRLSMPIGQKVEWMFGGFYTREHSLYYADAGAYDQTGALQGYLFAGTVPYGFKEYAAFTNVTVHFTDRFDVQFGGRESHLWQDQLAEYRDGVLNPVDCRPCTKDYAPSATNDAFTYLLTPRFRISPDHMAYARVATGFRPGGPKPAPGVTFELPQQNPDKTTDYEVGFKGSFFDRKLSYDLSLYHIKWEDIQMQLTAVNIINGVEVRGSYQGNASVAKSEGLDLSLEWRPISSMKFAGWIALNNAELTEDLPPEAVRGGSFGLAGDRLPFAARFSGSLSAGYDFPLADRVRGSTGISVTYIGDRKDILTSTAQRQDLDAFARADLRAGIEYRSWAGNVSVNNLTDRRGHISGGFGNIRPTDFYYIQPRTVALSVTKNFR